MVVSLLIRRVPGVLKTLSLREHLDLTTKFLDVAKFIIPSPLSLLSRCRLSFRVVGLKIFSLPTFLFKFPNIISTWYFKKSSKTDSNYS